MPTNTITKRQPKSLRHALEGLLLTRTQVEVGKMLGVSSVWVSQHTTGGHKHVAKGKMKEVAKGLGLTVEDLARLCRPTTNKV